MKNLDSNTIAGMVILALFFIWCGYLMFKKNDPEDTDDPDEFDPSQIF
jgi:hypothetical protein